MVTTLGVWLIVMLGVILFGVSVGFLMYFAWHWLNDEARETPRD